MKKCRNVNTAAAWLVGVALTVLAGCQPTEENSGKSLELGVPEDVIACPAQRADVCTQQYGPVCGYMQPSPRGDGQSSTQEWAQDTGDESSGQWKTYGNACSACAQAPVVGYRKGSCENNR